MEKSFFVDNRRRLIESLDDDSVLVLFSGRAPVKTADEEYYYTPNRNFYYITGIDREDFVLLVTKGGGAVAERLFAPAKANGLGGAIDHPLTMDEAKARSGIEDVQDGGHFAHCLESLLHRRPYRSLYLDLERRALAQPLSEAQQFAARIAGQYPYLNIQDAYYGIANMRRIKAPDEIKEIRRAIGITRQGIEAMMCACRPGMFEYALEAEFMYVSMRHGQREPAFKPIIAAGRNSLISHYAANNATIADGDLVLVDVGAASRAYASDISRAFPANGVFSDRQHQLYEVLLEANKSVIAALRPGVTMSDANREHTAALTERLVAIGLTKDNSEGLSVYCGPNHYLGLDVHDVGLYDIPFAPGMVLATESSVTIPAEGLSFRIEDDVLITQAGSECLSADILKEMDDIERIMRAPQ